MGELADLIYSRIVHGDEAHRLWLRERSVAIATELCASQRHDVLCLVLKEGVRAAFEGRPAAAEVGAKELIAVAVKHADLAYPPTQPEPCPESPAPAVPAPPQLPADGLDLRVAVERFENALIGQALVATGWNRTRAAALLGLNRTTLVEKLKARADAYPELAKHGSD